MTISLPATIALPRAVTPLQTAERRIPPSRGLVVAHNRAGHAFGLVDLSRWLRLERHLFKSEKADVLANGTALVVLQELLPAAAALDLRLSLRTDATAPVAHLRPLAKLGLFDVFLCPPENDVQRLAPWLAACRELDLPVRVQLQAPFSNALNVEQTAEFLAANGVVRVNLALADPFLTRAGCVGAAESQSTLNTMQTLVAELEARGVEANLLGLPFCLTEESSWPRVEGSRQLGMDHAHYLADAHRLAVTLFDRRPVVAAMVLRILLSNATLRRQPTDKWLLPWLLDRRFIYLFARVFRRLTLHLRLLSGSPEPRPQPGLESALGETRARTESPSNPICRGCALKRICDRDTPELRRLLPGVHFRSVPGEHVVSPLHFAARQPKHYDALDRMRLDAEEQRAGLADEALAFITNRPPDRLIGPHDYGVENAHFNRMESGLKWWSVTNTEKLSTPLGAFTPPFTVSVDFGAGIADYIGFSFGRHCKLVCPMEAYRHNLTLHVAADGRYILLRDRVPVRPSEFEGMLYLPVRLSERLEPRISAWNIDECIATQNVRVWTGPAKTSVETAVKYSIIIVSTRFTRRLHAVLRSLAHQQNFDLNTVEVIICYVPGIDATDDLIDSATLTYPNLHIVRSAFPERYMNSKGFLINETAKIARGEWIMLLDSDTLLPPDYFSKIEARSATAEFIAPDGRKLLPQDVTARILMGEIAPWEHWQELLNGPGEFRHRETFGIPVGFCQTFRAKYLQMFPYLEVDHFETADMRFGGELQNHLGEETRLSGTPVIHLDHGGSQWYGTQKHM
jgi:hypothetical protein